MRKRRPPWRSWPPSKRDWLLGAKRSLVTVEEIVDELEPRPGATVLPTWCVTAVAEAPRGAHPSYAHDYYYRDNGFYQRWDEISRERDSFQAWLDQNVFDKAGVT